MLGIYLASPLNRDTYLLAKGLAVAATLSIVCIGPPLLMLVANVLQSQGPTGVGDIITFSRSIADYPSMYAAIFSIILLAVLFLNLLGTLENILFKGNNRGYVTD